MQTELVASSFSWIEACLWNTVAFLCFAPRPAGFLHGVHQILRHGYVVLRDDWVLGSCGIQSDTTLIQDLPLYGGGLHSGKFFQVLH